MRTIRTGIEDHIALSKMFAIRSLVSREYMLKELIQSPHCFIVICAYIFLTCFILNVCDIYWKHIYSWSPHIYLLPGFPNPLAPQENCQMVSTLNCPWSRRVSLRWQDSSRAMPGLHLQASLAMSLSRQQGSSLHQSLVFSAESEPWGLTELHFWSMTSLVLYRQKADTTGYG